MALMRTANVGQIRNAAVPVRLEDDYLKGAGNGVLALFDVAYDKSYNGFSSGSNPDDGDVIKDLAGKGNGSINLYGDGEMPTLNGKTFDWSGVDTVGSTIDFPSAIAEHIAQQANQYFMVMGYFRMPTEADWLTAGALNQSMFCFTTAGGGFGAEPDLLTLYMLVSGGLTRLRTARWVSAGSYEIMNAVPVSSWYNAICQVAYYRTAAGPTLRVRGPNGVVMGSVQTSVPGKNTNALTGKELHVGVGPSWYSGSFTNARKFGFVRMAIEDLEASGRNPLKVLNDDWSRWLRRNRPAV